MVIALSAFLTYSLWDFMDPISRKDRTVKLFKLIYDSVPNDFQEWITKYGPGQKNIIPKLNFVAIYLLCNHKFIFCRSKNINEKL